LISKNLITKNDWRIFLGALRRWPRLAINIMFSYLYLVSISSSKEFSSSLKLAKIS
jgi:abequosyltransferase